MGQLESKSESTQVDEGLQNIRRRRNSNTNTTEQNTPTLSSTTTATSSHHPSGLSIDFLTLLGKNIYHHSSTTDQAGDYSRLSSDTNKSDESTTTTTSVHVTSKASTLMSNLAGKDVPRLVLIGTGGSGKYALFSIYQL